ncbi:2-amino-4-hydroxy-6-hydroxymethyldihydropteridine pyrophosphokinase [Arthrobacter sp. MYb229]|nr:2-amino-4-hydroxy-6-hydroxymethyldihydropteridine pyrophosphokinase [Arthrobacter sp. MYb229]PRB52076.1 2-amino-4-hydroxy-6-hydroxymethyldihydropteridine pyrophosphokinase [Arthrobacter sp. MYb216]
MPSTTGRCWPTWRPSRRWATRCWSAPAASVSSANCWPTARTRANRWAATWRPPRPPCSPPGTTPGRCACTMWRPAATRWKSCRPMDRISIQGISATGYHGVFDHEKREGQEFRIDVVLHVDITRAALSDDVADTVDYGAVSQLVVAQIQAGPWDLIEKLGAQIAEAILAAWRSVATVEVVVHKPQAPIPVPFSDVSISLTRQQSVHTAIIALGANLGDSAATLRSAIAELREHLEVLRTSPVALTKPVGGPPEQPDYTNQVIEVRTTLGPYELLELCQSIEANHERTREVRWEARTLDLDLITFDQLRLDEELLTLPHPRAHTRGFVLAPWSWMDADAVLNGQLVSRLAAEAADTADIIRL